MPDEATPITLVVFRRWKSNGGIIALFPELPSDYQGWYCDSYERVGQHGGADYQGVIRATIPVSNEDASDLFRELERRGYPRVAFASPVVPRKSLTHHRQPGDQDDRKDDHQRCGDGSRR